MISKSLLSEIRSLHRAKYRAEKKLFLAEGVKVVDELLRSGIKVQLIAGLQEYLGETEFPESVGRIVEVNNDDLLKISLLESPNKVLATASIPDFPILEWSGCGSRVVALDGIRDPGNLGTIIRTADWFGVHTIICSDDTVDCFNPKVVQASMGSLFRMRMFYGNLTEMLTGARDSGGYRVSGATLDGSNDVAVAPGKGVVLVLGSEAHGIHEDVLKCLDERLTISKSPDSVAESLNAGVALGILLSRLAQ